MKKKKDIRPRNNRGEAHGLWVSYYPNDGKLSYKCFYHNGKEVGYEELYDWGNTGNLVEKTYYI
jgi:antitoxin component YwqK of YwqJK toxin-antitoxin module